MQPLVLAIEPDVRQAAIVKRIVTEKVLANVTVVDSRDAALEAMRTSVPDVLLLSALLSPRDEDELIAHLRTLEHVEHLQTHTIPQLASAIGPEEKQGKGLLSSLWRRKGNGNGAAPAGCDPDLFADEIRSYLKRASEKKREVREGVGNGNAPIGPIVSARPAAPRRDEEPEPTAVTSSWESPFEWRPTGAAAARVPAKPSASPSPGPVPPRPEPVLASPEPVPESVEPAVEDLEPALASVELAPESPEPASFEPAPESFEPALASFEPAPASFELAPESPEPAFESAEPVIADYAIDELPLESPAIAVEAVESAEYDPEPADVADEPLVFRPEPFGVGYESVVVRADPASAESRQRLPLVVRHAREWWYEDGDMRPAASDPHSELSALLAAMSIPAVAAVTCAHGCRIRRVRLSTD